MSPNAIQGWQLRQDHAGELLTFFKSKRSPMLSSTDRSARVTDWRDEHLGESVPPECIRRDGS